MNATLVATACAVLMWPVADPDIARITGLQSGRRLELAPSRPGRPRTSAGWPLARPSPVAAALFAGAWLLLLPECGAVGGAELAAAAAMAGWAGLLVAGQARDGRRRAQRQEQVSLALALLAGELEAGASPSDALRRAGPVGADLVRRLDEPAELTERAEPAELTERAEPAERAERVDADPLARVAFSWRVSEATGIPLAGLLGRVRVDLAEMRATEREVATAVAGPQASAALLALLPILGLVLGTAMGAHPISVLLGTGWGRVLLDLGVAFDVAGVLWSARLIAGARSPGR